MHADVRADPVDSPICDPTVAWTSGNVAEAFPGVCTPLGFSFMHAPVELALRSAFCDIGVFSAGQIHVPERVEEQFWTAFSGRAAANMDQFRALADITPGTSASAVEQQLFGYVRAGTVDHNSKRRYPVIAVKAPRVLSDLPKRHDRFVDALRVWRTAALRGVDTLDAAACTQLLADARARFQQIMRLHFLATFVGNGLVDRLAETVAKLGKPGLEARLLSGVGTDENRVADDLWDLAHGHLDLATFLDRHGYHGPQEGQLDSTSWRESPESLQPRLADFRAMGAASPRAPRHRSRTQEQARRLAQQELERALPVLQRPVLRLLVRLAGRFLALREQGKAGYLITFDVARAAARRLGDHLVTDQVLAGQGDIFYLTYTEATGTAPGNARKLVGLRRDQYLDRLRYRLPESWVGAAQPVLVDGVDGQRAPPVPGSRAWPPAAVLSRGGPGW